VTLLGIERRRRLGSRGRGPHRPIGSEAVATGGEEGQQPPWAQLR
jgi:hypothetical protein